MTWAPVDCLITSTSTPPSTLGSIHTGQAHQACCGAILLAVTSAQNTLPQVHWLTPCVLQVCSNSATKNTSQCHLCHHNSLPQNS